MPSALVHIGAGIGNIVLATPLLIALQELGFEIDLLLDADYAETATLFRGWSVVRQTIVRSGGEGLPANSYDYLVPAIPPFYWSRVAHLYHREKGALPRPDPCVFYANEQQFYMSFAWQLGFPRTRTVFPRLPIAPPPDDDAPPVTASTVVLAPGCKTGEMASKRWPWFGELASRLSDVAVVGTPDDLYHFDGTPLALPDHVCNFAGRLSLRQTGELLACCGVVVGNDAGLSHLAAAIGVPVVMIFGPTPHTELGAMPSHVRVLRSMLPCEPCWRGRRFAECRQRIDCLRRISVEDVLREIAAAGVPTN